VELRPEGILCRTGDVVSVHPLSPRHRELVEMLAAHPAGLSAARVADLAFGDPARTVSARAELSRLRRILGPVPASRPCRLTCPISLQS